MTIDFGIGVDGTHFTQEGFERVSARYEAARVKARPIPLFPAYAITQAGEVYRVDRNKPYKLKPYYTTNGRTELKHANVRMRDADGFERRRGVRSLVRAVWGGDAMMAERSKTGEG